MTFHLSKLHQRATHKETFLKFIGLLAVLLGYFFYLSTRFDLVTSGYVAAITWSFFVLCTPVADAGFLLDFPLRLLFGVRMFVVEIGVWVLALAINVVAILLAPEIYSATAITGLLYQILSQPWPYWGLIMISATGTFLSIYFGDEMLDVFHHHERTKYHAHRLKYRMLALAGVIGLSVISYYYLLANSGLDFSGVGF